MHAGLCRDRVTEMTHGSVKLDRHLLLCAWSGRGGNCNRCGWRRGGPGGGCAQGAAPTAAPSLPPTPAHPRTSYGRMGAHHAVLEGLPAWILV